ncbi:MAG: ankyrin repeat domain-containing protein [Rickettsiales bacterium]|nr:MAG: ankyrin repeat domain-containing protein [Rickettsiales bacterium]
MKIKNNLSAETILLSKKLFEEVADYSQNKNSESLNLIKELLDQGADANFSVYPYYTTLSYASSQNLVEIIEIFIEKKVNINGKFFGMWKFFDKDVGFASSSLHVAAEKNFYPLAELLVKNNANLNCDVNSKLSPLHIAISKQSVEIVKLLIDYKANLTEKDYCHEKDAHEWAREARNEDIVSYITQVATSGEIINEIPSD